MEKTNVSNTKYFLFVLILASMITYTFLADRINIYAQSATMSTKDNATMEQQQHAEHVVDNLIISEHIPLRGQLDNGDYVLLMDLTPFATSIEGHSHIAMKIPCNVDGTPKVTIVTGVAPNLNSIDIGNAINNGTLNGKYLDLSAEGKSCLYHAELPNGTTDITLANNSNKTLSFDDGGYYSVTITVHGTAIQHLAANETRK
ncbi:MAG: hypothetical protein ACRD97_11565 [Nitrososphaeraceae archaeon]